MRYTPTERKVLQNALYELAGRFSFALPIDVPPHPREGWKSPRRGGMLHQGIEFGAPIGEPVYAIGPGVVVVSRDWGTGTGKWIVVEHTGHLAGFQSRYIHLDKRLVKVGDPVMAGDMIGHAGVTGRALVPHLHFDVQVDFKQHPTLRKVFTRTFIGREFRGMNNIPSEILLPLADEERPGYLEPVPMISQAESESLPPPTQSPNMPPPGIPLVPYDVWVAAGMGIAAGGFAWVIARQQRALSRSA